MAYNNENQDFNLTDSVSELQEVISEKSGPQKKRKVKKPAKRNAADRRTMSLLFGILAVGICLLCVSIMGMVGVVGDMQKAPVEQTTATPVQGQVMTTVPETTTQAQQIQNEVTTVPQQETPGTPVANAPQTDEQWLTFFNDAVNKLKSEAPAMTKSKQTKTADIQLSNPLGDAYVSAAKDKYLSDEVVKTPIAKGDKAAAQANISPDGASFVSMLTLADIKSISGSTDANGNYLIKIEMNDVSNPDKQSSYGKIFQFMLVDDVMNTYAPDMGATVDRSNVELKYSKCSATATISPDGKVISYETTVNANMILRNAKVKIINTDLDATLYSITKYYDINW
ncbi:MAG: hypothetical protein IKW03_09910 [Clostridia bacterium]|nr:hypothetical protein [Clostridia bacterium]